MASGPPSRAWLLRMKSTLEAVMSAYRAGDYKSALEKAEGLKDGISKTAPYCFLRGGMLCHLGRLVEAEESLREGLPLEEDPRRRSLVFDELASVLMNQKRFHEAIEFYEHASRAWPERGAARRGIAEVLLRQGCEFPEALKEAQRAVAIDKRVAAGSQKEKQVLEHRLGQDLAVLAWALAVNSAGSATVEFSLGEAIRLCGDSAKAILAQVHYHAGQAYLALQNAEKSREHFLRGAEIDPQGIFGEMARSTITKPSM